MSYHSNQRSNGCSTGRSLRFNSFLQTVSRIAHSEEHDPQYIIPMFRNLSSAHFLCGPPTSLNHELMQSMPWGIWQKVCAHFSAAAQFPYYRQSVNNKSVGFKEKSDVFISSKTTEQFVRSRFLMEQFDSARRLYQYLNWTLRISKVAQTVALLEGRNGGRMLVINVELHDRNGNVLYALCPPNDVTTHRAQNWQLAALLNAAEVVALLGVSAQSLPLGVRAVSAQYAAHRELTVSSSVHRLKAHLRDIDGERKAIRYAHLKCIQTGSGQKAKRKECPEEEVLTIGLSTFYQAVRSALDRDDVELIPIVSIVSKKIKERSHRNRKHEDFSVDYLLPVQVGNVWVGVVYRNNECSMALLDRYDIANKAILCCPQFDTRSLDWFQNGYNRLRVVPDEEAPVVVPTMVDTDSMTMGSRSPSPSTSMSSAMTWGSSVRSPSVGSDHGDLYLSPSPMTPTVCALTPPPAMSLSVAPKVVPMVTAIGGVTAEMAKRWEADRVYFEQISMMNKQILSRF
jgi:hypothetical protein